MTHCTLGKERKTSSWSWAWGGQSCILYSHIFNKGYCGTRDFMSIRVGLHAGAVCCFWDWHCYIINSTDHTCLAFNIKHKRLTYHEWKVSNWKCGCHKNFKGGNVLWFKFWNKNSAFLISSGECPCVLELGCLSKERKVLLSLPCMQSRARGLPRTPGTWVIWQKWRKNATKLLGQAAVRLPRLPLPPVRAMWRAWHSWRFVYTNPCVEIPRSDDIPQGQPLMMNFLALFRGGEEEAGGTSQDSKFAQLFWV